MIKLITVDVTDYPNYWRNFLLQELPWNKEGELTIKEKAYRFQWRNPQYRVDREEMVHSVVAEMMKSRNILYSRKGNIVSLTFIRDEDATYFMMRYA